MLMKTPIPEDETSVAGFAKDRLKSFIERLESVEEEIKDRNSDKRDIYAEAKGEGYDVKALRAIVSIRRQDADARAEHEAIVDLYMTALGMLPD